MEILIGMVRKWGRLGVGTKDTADTIVAAAAIEGYNFYVKKEGFVWLVVDGDAE